MVNILHVYDHRSFGKYRIFRLIRLIFFHKKRVPETHPAPQDLKSARNTLLIKACILPLTASCGAVNSFEMILWFAICWCLEMKVIP